MTTFSEEVEVEVAELRREAVRVVAVMNVASGIMPMQAVAMRHLGGGAFPDEEIRAFDALELDRALYDAYPLGPREQGANHGTFAFRAPSQNLERIVMSGLQDTTHGFGDLLRGGAAVWHGAGLVVRDWGTRVDRAPRLDDVNIRVPHTMKGPTRREDLCRIQIHVSSAV
jgi:hypothetical protein